MSDDLDFLKFPAEVLHVRRVGGEIVLILSRALFVAAAVVAVLMVTLWKRDDDFPGRHLFTLLPLLGAALTMWWSVERVERGL